MTLVLSLATPDYVVQVSDRRIAHLKSGAEFPDANKSVMLCNRMAFAYTGMSVLESQPTSIWLWRVIQELKTRCSTKNVVEYLAKRAAIAVSKTNRLHYPEDWQLRQTFVGVGWASLPGDDTLTPIIARITNCHDQFGQPMDLPTKEFAIQPRLYFDRKYGWEATGTPLAPKEHAELARKLNKCAKHGTGPAAPVRCFCDAIWKVHRRKRSLVSDNVLIVVIPKTAAMRHTIALFTESGGSRSGASLVTNGCKEADEPLRGEHMSLFAYVPKHGEKPIQHAPLLACPGRGAFSDLAIGPMQS